MKKNNPTPPREAPEAAESAEGSVSQVDAATPASPHFRKSPPPLGWWLAAMAIVLLAFGLGRCAPADTNPGEGAKAEKAANVSEYVCPMHPQIRQPEFGTCPICFMDLVPADMGGGSGEVPGLMLSPAGQALAHVQTQPVQTGPVAGTLELLGRVDVNETAQVDLTARVGGRIERLMVKATGERVRRGQVLARLYSPQLLTAQRTMLQARESARAAEADGSDVRLRAARATEEAARNELRLLGMSDEQLDSILREGRARETVDIFAQAAGTVRERHVSEGEYVEAGMRLFSLAALDTLWVQLDVHESQLSLVDEGMRVEVRTMGEAHEVLAGTIGFVDPVVDMERRVARARVVLKNPGKALRPGMYVRGRVEVVHGSPGEAAISVPRAAVLWTGTRSLVYRALGPGHYVPVEVELGPRVGEHYLIKSGLSATDEVVTNGAFRLDASLQIRGESTMMAARAGAPAGGSGAPALVEVSAEGTSFDPPVQKARVPPSAWICDMGTVHYARAEEGDGRCPRCGMALTAPAATTNPGGAP